MKGTMFGEPWKWKSRAQFFLAFFLLVLAVPDSGTAQDVDHWLDWRPDRARLITIPTGNGVAPLAARLDVTGTWTPFVAGRPPIPYETATLRPSVTLGVVDWLSVHMGYWPQHLPPGEGGGDSGQSFVYQKDQVFGGLELTGAWGDRRVSIGGQLTHPRGNDLGRLLSESVIYGVLHWKGTTTGYSATVGWRGAPLEEAASGWAGSSFVALGAYRTLLPNLEIVSESYAMRGTIGIRPALRTGVWGLSVEGSVGCALMWGMGIGGRCEGPAVTASYTLGGR